MKPTQIYSLAEIKGCIDFLRNDKKISQEKIDGMDILAGLIESFKEPLNKPLELYSAA